MKAGGETVPPLATPFFRNASVMGGRDGSPSRPLEILAGAVASARRPYLPSPAVTEKL
jgi:hypothetical protein